MVEQTTSQHTALSQRTAQVGTVALIAKPGGPNTGVGRYVHMLHEGLCAAGVQATRVAPAVPPLPNAGYTALRRLGMDARAFLLNYPVWAAYPPADVYHITSQNLASLLLFRRPPSRVVVTVHDIIPFMLRKHPRLCTYRSAADRLFDRLAMLGLRRADHLIAVSHYTKQCMVEQLQINPERISVIYEGIEHDHFKPMAVPNTIRHRYGLTEGRHYLIYVGSEDPRKNLETLFRALALARHTLPNIELIKVGRAHFEHERQRLVALAEELGIRTAVHFLDDVPEDDLPLLYNLADVCVMPSLYEGFGFPVLEAMACGTPVIAANAASLPELVGEAGVLFKARDAEQLAASVVQTCSKEWQSQSAQHELAHSREFRWTHTCEQTRSAYMSMGERL